MQRVLLALLDGRTVLIRPIASEDKPLIVEFARRLSPETAFRRFLSPKVRFSDAELAYLTEVDGRDHIAYVAAAGRALVAVARTVKTAPDTAELAIVVADGWQGLGLGRALTRHVAQAAAAHGVTRISGTMLAHNRPAFRLMRGLGGFEHDELSHGVREIVTRLAA
jgi:GNAT superfamily N-acetyltransferase